MRAVAHRAPVLALLGLLALALASGCAQNPYALQSQVYSLQQTQRSQAEEFAAIQTRATTLDRDNQELQMLIGQERQQNRLLSDQLTAMRSQLQAASEQLADVQGRAVDSERRAEAIASTAAAQLASQKRRVGAGFAANSSLRQQLPELQLPGVQVRADGDVIRLELPTETLFEPGLARLSPQTARILDQLAQELGRNYARQIIGIEGHAAAEGDPNDRAGAHTLSLARATAVFDYLVQRSRIPAEQLFVAGHGANHPLVSNATPAGRTRNSRVEVVIYPEQVTPR